jgi:hypothetical protein
VFFDLSSWRSSGDPCKARWIKDHKTSRFCLSGLTEAMEENSLGKTNAGSYPALHAQTFGSAFRLVSPEVSLHLNPKLLSQTRAEAS